MARRFSRIPVAWKIFAEGEVDLAEASGICMEAVSVFVCLKYCYTGLLSIFQDIR